MIAPSELRDVNDVAALYRLFAPSLHRIVRRDVHASDPVIEDACQFAWSRFVVHAAGVRREAALAWLVKTAIREAFKLSYRAKRDVSLDATLEAAGEQGLGTREPDPGEIIEHRGRLDALASLSERQQRLIWLQGFGFSYGEMAVMTGDTTRTVQRQLLRARHRLHSICAE